MDIYLVGGAVRDALLARDTAAAAHFDRDWVVVGATPEAMAAQGYLPVGKDFPVFLHPQSREEYALARLLPEVARLWGVPQRADYHPEVDTGVHLMMVLDMSARLGASLPVRFACLCHDLGKGTTPADVLPRHIGHEERSARLLRAVCDRWRVPRESRELADVVAREHGNIHRSGDLNATTVLRLLERCDALRRPARFAEVLQACECDARGRLGFEDSTYPQRERLLRALDAAGAVDPQPLADQVTAGLPADASAQARAQLGPRIAHAIHQARAEAVASALNA